MDRKMCYTGCEFLEENKLVTSMYELRKKTLSFVDESKQFLRSFPKKDKCALCPDSYLCLKKEREALPFIIEFISNSVPREVEELYDKIEKIKKFRLEPEAQKKQRAEEQSNWRDCGLHTMPRECWGTIWEDLTTEKERILYLKEEIQGLKRDRSFYKKELLKAQQTITKNLSEHHWGFSKCIDCGNILYTCCSTMLGHLKDWEAEENSAPIEVCEICKQELNKCCWEELDD